MQYDILHYDRLQQYGHLMWDVDGTMTRGDVLSDDIVIRIFQLCQNQHIYNSFITGRDPQWIIEKVIEVMGRFPLFSRALDKLSFWAEVGCVKIEVSIEVGPNGQSKLNIQKVVNPLLEGHDIMRSDVRNALRALAYDPTQDHDGKMLPYEAGVPNELPNIIFDANKVPWQVDLSKYKPACPDYIWSPYKEVFGTLEIIRDSTGQCLRPDSQKPFVKIIEDKLAELGCSDTIGVEEVGTALNIIPKLNGISLGKAWASGMSLLHIANHKLGGSKVLDHVIDGTLSFGDGKSDLDFTKPYFSAADQRFLTHKTLPIVFVGGEKDLPGPNDQNAELLDNIIIRSTGVNTTRQRRNGQPYLDTCDGPDTVIKVLDVLKTWDFFQRL